MTGSGVIHLFIVGEWRIARSLSSLAHSRDRLANPPHKLGLQSWNQLEPATLIAVAATFETATTQVIRLPHCHMWEDRIMSNDDPPFVYEGLDPVPEPKSTIADVSEAVKGTAHRIGDAIDAGRKPGMPLSILSNIAREAPLGSLLVAFLLGIAVARRR
jgi:hypothetical protein